MDRKIKRNAIGQEIGGEQEEVDKRLEMYRKLKQQIYSDLDENKKQEQQEQYNQINKKI